MDIRTVEMFGSILKHPGLYSDLLQALKGLRNFDRIRFLAEPETLLISASAVPHCRFTVKHSITVTPLAEFLEVDKRGEGGKSRCNNNDNDSGDLECPVSNEP